MLLKDPKAIAAIERGEDQLSVGYHSTFILDGPNTATLIAPPTYNHIALVDKGAAGPEAKVLASKEKRMARSRRDAGSSGIHCQCCQCRH